MFVYVEYYLQPLQINTSQNSISFFSFLSILVKFSSFCHRKLFLTSHLTIFHFFSLPPLRPSLFSICLTFLFCFSKFLVAFSELLLKWLLYLRSYFVLHLLEHTNSLNIHISIYFLFFIPSYYFRLETRSNYNLS